MNGIYDVLDRSTKYNLRRDNRDLLFINPVYVCIVQYELFFLYTLHCISKN
jgi:hypothetical protein